MKMSDVFELPINGACVHVNFHKLKANYNDGVTPFDAIDIAINNHDRLTSENARLREALRESIDELNRYEQVAGVMSFTKSRSKYLKLLTELEKDQ